MIDKAWRHMASRLAHEIRVNLSTPSSFATFAGPMNWYNGWLYPAVIGGLPLLSMEEARTLSDEEIWDRVMV